MMITSLLSVAVDDSEVPGSDKGLVFHSLEHHASDEESNEIIFASGMVLNVRLPFLCRNTRILQPVRLSVKTLTSFILRRKWKSCTNHSTKY